MQDEHDNEFIGRANGMNGKKTSIKPFGSLAGGSKITRIKVIGKEERTLSEKARDMFLLLVLQGLRDLSDPNFPLIKYLFFPDQTTPAIIQKQASPVRMAFPGERLNDSQAAVVAAMVYSPSPFVIVHGKLKTGIAEFI